MRRLNHPIVRLTLLIIVAGVIGFGWAVEGLGSRVGTEAATNRTTGDRGRIATLQTRIETLTDATLKAPDNPIPAYQLGEAYLQQARETADPGAYSRAEQYLLQSYESRRDAPLTLAALGNLALSRHQFDEALDWGNKAAALSPLSAYPYGVIGDALTDLGRYDEAAAAYQLMGERKPDLTAYARLSYSRELRGDLDGAIAMMEQAALAGTVGSESRAWTLYQLGLLQFLKNDLTLADGAFRRANDEYPGYVYSSVGMARVAAARGDYATAITLLEPASKRMPLPEIVILLGDVYGAAGRTEDAENQYRLVGAITKLFAANGVDSTIEMALFDLDHGRDLPTALSTAITVYEKRPSIKTADTLAWAYYQNGDDANALRYAREGLRLGSIDPPALYRAMKIAQRAGSTAEARGYAERLMALNPRYSVLYAQDLLRTAESLGVVAQ